jgi:hypothetical protein
MIDDMGWADLDKANKADGHYQQRPTWLNEAQAAMTAAWESFLTKCEGCELCQVTQIDVDAAYVEYSDLSKRYDELYILWLRGGEPKQEQPPCP